MNKIFNHSCESMHELPDASIHLMVTSPPYNVGKEYEDSLSLSDYRNMLKQVWKETKRVLIDTGRVAINIGNTGYKPYLPLSSYITIDMLEIGFNMRGEILWDKSASRKRFTAWGSWLSPRNPIVREAHEYILLFSKGDFSRDAADKTMTKEQYMAYTESIWKLAPESAKRIGHPAPFPVELPYRLIQLYTFENDIVLDPFMGSGTTALAAKQSKRQWVGYEKENKYIEIAQNRLQQEYLF